MGKKDSVEKTEKDELFRKYLAGVQRSVAGAESGGALVQESDLLVEGFFAGEKFLDDFGKIAKVTSVSAMVEGFEAETALEVILDNNENTVILSEGELELGG